MHVYPNTSNCKSSPFTQVMPGFAAAHIEGVELYNVGQQTDLGMSKITLVTGMVIGHSF